jgi:hypothetical protein
MKIKSDDIAPQSFGIGNGAFGLTFVGRLIYRSVFGLLVVLLFFAQTEAAPGEAMLTDAPLKSIQAGANALTAAVLPVYRIKLRVQPATAVEPLRNSNRFLPKSIESG